MPDPFSPDPERTARAGAEEVAADIERLRRTAPDRRPFRQRLRREVRRIEVAALGFLVVAAVSLALHLAQRGNQVSLTERTGATSPTTPPVRDQDTARPARPASTPELTKGERGPVSTAAVNTAVAPAPKPAEALTATPNTTTAPTTTTVEPPTTTSTSTTSTSTTTTSPTTTTTTAPSPPPPGP
jgi:hypothetical protein